MSGGVCLASDIARCKKQHIRDTAKGRLRKLLFRERIHDDISTKHGIKRDEQSRSEIEERRKTGNDHQRAGKPDVPRDQ